MLKNYFKTAFRNLRSNKLYTSINILGLTVGLAACLLIGIYIKHELSYDRFNINAERMVRATMEYSVGGTVNNVATTGTKVGPDFKRTFPAIEEYVRTYLSQGAIKIGDHLFEEPRILYADPPFFKIFSFRIIKGDASTALDAPDKIVITHSMAKKYFGSESPLNQTITMGSKDFRISAVCEDAPQNSQIKFDMVTQFLNMGEIAKGETWWNANWITYFLLHKHQDLAVLQQQVSNYMNSAEVKTDAGARGNDYLTYHLEPLTKVHLYSALSGSEPNGSIAYIYMLSAIALLILLIACANYTNLATAQSAGRSGEIGMRKVMGASKKQVFIQFISESAIITCIAAAFSLVLALLLIPYFNNVTGKHFTAAIVLQPLPIVSLLLLSLLVSFLAGLYPALILSGTQVMGVLKKGFNFTGGNNRLRKTLIVAQFGISIFLIIYTIIIMQQMHFMQTKNLGYDKDQVVVLPIGGNMLNNFETLKEAFLQVPGVQGVTASYETPEYINWGDAITTTDEKGKHDISLKALPVELDFTKTMKMQLIAGRDFLRSDFAIMDTSNDYANYHRPYMINETLAKKIGWTPGQAIGKTITKGASGPVVGVVKDFNFTSLRDPVGPLLIFLDREQLNDYMVRISGSNVKSTLTALETTFKQRVPNRPFNYHFLDEDYNKLYLTEQRTSALFSSAAAIAIILACLGLFGLAAFTTVQRTKEIGIRRVLGAQIGSIIFLIANHFLRLVGIATLVAVPLAWWAGNKWLRDFAYRIPIHANVFILTAIGTALIALFTVAYHSIRAALINPAESLRSE